MKKQKNRAARISYFIGDLEITVIFYKWKTRFEFEYETGLVGD